VKLGILAVVAKIIILKICFLYNGRYVLAFNYLPARSYLYLQQSSIR